MATEKLVQYSPASVETSSLKDDDFLLMNATRFDIILSLCHFHKKQYLLDTLEAVNCALAKKGVLVSGDWHSSLSHNPYFVEELLKRIGVDSWRLKLFKDMFKAYSDPNLRKSFTEEENMAISKHQEYWANVYNEILASPSTMAQNARHYVLGAFDTTNQRLKLMDQANLITDSDKVRKAFPQARMPQNPIRMEMGVDRASIITSLRGKSR